MGRAILLTLLFIAATVLSGCATAPDGGGSLLQRQYTLAQDLTVVVSAGGVWHIDFSTNGGLASYNFQLTDDSSVNIGFIRTQNIDAYAGGSATTCYGCHSSVRAAQDSVNLDAGAWSLIIACRNTFADCDGIMQTASYYS